MSHPTKGVQSQNGLLRDMVPFYSLAMGLFSAVVIGMTYALMRWLDPSAAALCTVGGLAGVLGVNWAARPSYMVVAKHQEASLISLLERSKYRYVDDEAYWVPPLPRWLRWKHNFVKFSADQGSVQITGPANVLTRMAALAS